MGRYLSGPAALREREMQSHMTSVADEAQSIATGPTVLAGAWGQRPERGVEPLHHRAGI